MTNYMMKESEMVSHKVSFEWHIKNFSAHKMFQGTNHCIESPPFKWCSLELHFEMSRSTDTIQLSMVGKRSDKRFWISECEIGFKCSDGETWYAKKFTGMKDLDISYGLSINYIEDYCIVDNGVKVRCSFNASTLKHNLDAQVDAQTDGNKNKFVKKGHTMLAENIGNFLEDSRFSDVLLKVGDSTFQAHKAILASRSKVFDGMFQSGMKESQENVVDIAEMSPDIVKQMLQYIYAGSIEDLSMDRAIDLYTGADRYDLQELKGWCKEFILKHISSDEVCKVAAMADLHSDEELTMASKSVFKENLRMILSSEAWRDFGKKNHSLQTNLLESALSSDN